MVGCPYSDCGGNCAHFRDSAASERKFHPLAVGIYFPAAGRGGNCRRALRIGEARRAQSILRLLRVLDGDVDERRLRPVSASSPRAESCLFVDSCERQSRRLRAQGWRGVVDDWHPARNRILHLRLSLLRRQSRGREGPDLSLSLNGRAERSVRRIHTLVLDLPYVYAQKLMETKLLIALLARTLSGCHSDLGSMSPASSL